MERYPTVFSPLYCNIVKAGEISGSVPEVLKRLIYIIEHEQKIKAKIKDALRYPIIVVGALGISFFVLLTYVIPKFAVLFEKAGVELPLPTRLAIQLYTFMADYWQILIVGMGALIVGLVVSLRTEEGKYVRDSIYLKLPLVGAIFVKAAMSRFASIFAILHASGVSVVNSMNILSGTIGNVVIAKAFDNMSERLKEGQGITEPLKSSAVFPPMVIDMIAIGEETGNLEDMLQEISNHYDDEVEFSVNSISEYLGPILIAGLAGNVGFFAMAIFLPMWEMINLVK
jgi:type IV pilus assembly protein PilC